MINFDVVQQQYLYDWVAFTPNFNMSIYIHLLFFFFIIFFFIYRNAEEKNVLSSLYNAGCAKYYFNFYFYFYVLSVSLCLRVIQIWMK